MMREETWRAARAGQLLVVGVGVGLICLGIVNHQWAYAGLGLSLVAFAAVLRWLWNKVPTATGDDIERMS
ncbi:hypothetical protein IFT73_03920 [Aeromicrobium sp. CFBP 8757]|uniref:hypothetical protein n=1 Tax=Aeromicrobium sp. CFBP 8757 TaxID=2775288 RepID=UPI00177F13D3|nr:hypothetical protein [Aeromicrobium sp. CFBP 8757]MBD8605990.1 hypothetical protein [Aeromicrobium sp. CFBP 8757]